MYDDVRVVVTPPGLVETRYPATWPCRTGAFNAPIGHTDAGNPIASCRGGGRSGRCGYHLYLLGVM